MYVPSEELYERLWEFFDVFYSESKRKEDDKPMSNPNNKAPKEMEGSYTLTIEGNKIEVVDKEGNVGMARCHPDDEFSLEVGMKEAFTKLEEDKNKIKVGDMVKIVNPSSSYSTLTDFFVKNNLLEYGVRYRYGVSPYGNEIGTVVYINNGKYVVEVRKANYEGNDRYKSLTCFDPIYVVGTQGLRKVAKQ